MWTDPGWFIRQLEVVFDPQLCDLQLLVLELFVVFLFFMENSHHLLCEIEYKYALSQISPPNFGRGPPHPTLKCV